MTPEEAREIDRLEFEADCRAARERAYALIAARRIKPEPQGQAPTLPKGERTLVIRRSNARLYSLDGKSRSLEEWSAMCGHSVAVLRWRMKHGMNFEQAMTTPRLKPGTAWSVQAGVVVDLPASQGTGGGPLAQDFPQIEILTE